MAPSNLANKEHSYVLKLNFWNRCKDLLTNTAVSGRYGYAGQKRWDALHYLHWSIELS